MVRSGGIARFIGRARVLLPQFQRAVQGGANEVVVGGEQGQVVVDAKRRQQGIDGADLNAGAATTAAQRGGVDVILAVRPESRCIRRAPAADQYSAGNRKVSWLRQVAAALLSKGRKHETNIRQAP